MQKRKQFKGWLMLVLVAVLVLLPACDGEEQTPTPDLAEDYVPVVSVTGEVVPALWATVSAQIGGRVVAVPVEMGDEVEAGAVLVQLDDADARLAVAQAEAQLASAEARLESVQASAREEEIAAAEAGVDQAQAGLQRVLEGAGDQQIIAAEAELRNAEAELQQAQAAYDPIQWLPEIGLRPESLRLQQATNAYEAARARYEDLVVGPSYAEVRQAQAAVAEAEAQLELLKAGARTEAVRVAETEVEAARVNLEQAELTRERTTITAPFAGTVGSTYVRAGEFISPGQPLVTLGDLTTLRVETTDLDEIDVAQIEEGEEVTLTFDAFPDRTYTGEILRIAPMADQGSGGVNYTVYVELAEVPEDVRWGMTAFVDIEPED
ncbi:MAG: HlyD family secretion protein [Anaerolineales bacterium]